LGILRAMNHVSLSKCGLMFVFVCLSMYSSVGTAAICLHCAVQEIVTDMTSFKYTWLCIIYCL
jgi:hypothetical protein